MNWRKGPKISPFFPFFPPGRSGHREKTKSWRTGLYGGGTRLWRQRGVFFGPRTEDGGVGDPRRTSPRTAGSATRAERHRGRRGRRPAPNVTEDGGVGDPRRTSPRTAGSETRAERRKKAKVLRRRSSPHFSNRRHRAGTLRMSKAAARRDLDAMFLNLKMKRAWYLSDVSWNTSGGRAIIRFIRRTRPGRVCST